MKAPGLWPTVSSVCSSLLSFFCWQLGPGVWSANVLESKCKCTVASHMKGYVWYKCWLEYKIIIIFFFKSVILGLCVQWDCNNNTRDLVCLSKLLWNKNPGFMLLLYPSLSPSSEGVGFFCSPSQGSGVHQNIWRVLTFSSGYNCCPYLYGWQAESAKTVGVFNWYHRQQSCECEVSPVPDSNVPGLLYSCLALKGKQDLE